MIGGHSHGLTARYDGTHEPGQLGVTHPEPFAQVRAFAGGASVTIEQHRAQYAIPGIRAAQDAVELRGGSCLERIAKRLRLTARLISESLPTRPVLSTGLIDRETE